MSNRRAGPDPKKVEPFNKGARQAFIEAFFKSRRLFDQERMKAARKEAADYLCQELKKAHYRNVNQVFFEYQVDYVAWARYVRERKAQSKANAWPWDKFPDPRDLKEGAPPVYRVWRLKLGL
mgnify:CR=1 FL=1